MKLQDIKNFVDSEFDIDISKNTRKREYVEARALYYKLAKEYTKLSLERIGGKLNRDHATVIHALNNVWEHAITTNEDVYDSYYKFKDMMVELNSEDKNEETLNQRLDKAKREIASMKAIGLGNYQALKDELEAFKKENKRFNDLISQLDDDRKKEELFFRLESAVKMLKSAVYR
jgi:transcriptional regulator with AAA-type ATPase domain